jgi:hypothetical protein
MQDAPKVSTDRLRDAFEAAAGELSTARPQPEVRSDVGENIFQLLGHRARTRTSTELWLIAGCGLLNAVLLSWRYPALSWLAAGCAATGAYGAWGLLDRAARVRMSGEERCRGTSQQLRALRDLAAAAGTGAALWAVLALMATALGNWIH